MIEEHDLFEIIVSTRGLFEELLISCNLEKDNKLSITEGTCLYSCILLESIINQFTKYKAMIRGGGEGDGGLEIEGIVYGHYWLEVIISDTKTYIIDITADQFGKEPVVILPIEYSDNYKPGNQDIIDQHVVELENLCKLSV